MKNVDRHFPGYLTLAILLNALGLFAPIPDQDAALYAMVAKHMVTSGNWFDLWAYGGDWLDKPHFPFWVTALIFKVLGINSFAYKFPAFLFWLLGLWYTYRLARELWGESVAKVAVILSATALHVIISNADVRAEPYLTTLTIAAIFHVLRLCYKHEALDFLLSAAFIAAAIMTKGLFILVTILGGFVLYWLLTSQWKALLQWRWLLLSGLVFVFIIPEILSLYLQFDMHPEKTVFGQKGVSGLRFFVWDSQFGRFFNNGPIKGSGDLTFFFHTTLWAFLPWTFPLLAALGYWFSQRKREMLSDRAIVVYSALLTFFLFTFSKFQLPHYIIIIFPQLAMLTASFLVSELSLRTLRLLSITQLVILFLMAGLLVFLSFFADLPHRVLLIILVVICLLLGIYISKKREETDKILRLGLLACIVTYVFLNGIFYQFLPRYQAGENAALFANKMNGNRLRLGMVESQNLFEFYSERPVELLKNWTEAAKFLSTDSSVVFIQKDKLEPLKKILPVDTLAGFDYFRTTMLTRDFLDANTRRKVLGRYYLVRRQPPVD